MVTVDDIAEWKQRECTQLLVAKIDEELAKNISNILNLTDPDKLGRDYFLLKGMVVQLEDCRLWIKEMGCPDGN